MGRANKPLYERYAELKNELSRLNGHDDLGDAWRDKYETETFGADVQSLYRDMEPLYLELHAYIRRKVRNLKIYMKVHEYRKNTQLYCYILLQLYNVYGEENIDLNGTLPAHLLG